MHKIVIGASQSKLLAIIFNVTVLNCYLANIKPVFARAIAFKAGYDLVQINELIISVHGF